MDPPPKFSQPLYTKAEKTSWALPLGFSNHVHLWMKNTFVKFCHFCSTKCNKRNQIIYFILKEKFWTPEDSNRFLPLLDKYTQFHWLPSANKCQFRFQFLPIFLQFKMKIMHGIFFKLNFTEKIFLMPMHLILISIKKCIEENALANNRGIFTHKNYNASHEWDVTECIKVLMLRKNIFNMMQVRRWVKMISYNVFFWILTFLFFYNISFLVNRNLKIDST